MQISSEIFAAFFGMFLFIWCSGNFCEILVDNICAMFKSFALRFDVSEYRFIGKMFTYLFAPKLKMILSRRANEALEKRHVCVWSASLLETQLLKK